MIKTARFHIPKHIKTPKKQLQHCLEVIGKYRQELTPLRKQNSLLKNKLLWKEAEKVKLWEENKSLKDQLKKRDLRIKELEQKLHKKEKTTNRYRIALFDSGNFSDPEEINKKPRGGQKGHKDTNRESRPEKPYKKIRIYAKKCGKCKTSLPRVNSTKQKRLIDINLNPQIINLLIESERQWCPQCQKEVCSKDEKSLPFTEYGINILMVVMILRFRGSQSMETISEVMRCFFRLKLPKSSVSNLLASAKKYLKGRYEELKQLIRAGKIMYNDETGWKIAGRSAWMWIMANEEHSVYVPAESRGKGIMEEIYGDSEAYSVHDGYGAYVNTVPKEKQLKCWSHILGFAYEETYGLEPESTAINIRNRLVAIYDLKDKKDGMKLEDFEKLINTKLEQLINTEIDQDDYSSKAILKRVAAQKLALARSLALTDSGTNNLSERELRGLTNMRKISYGSKTFKGMEVTAILASVMQSIHRDKDAEMIPSLRKFLRRGVCGMYGQYSHRAFFDSS